MYRIGICDDEIGTCSSIEDGLLKYAENKKIRIDAEVFFSGEGLCKYLKNREPFDLIFLDIVLDKMNGVEVGRIIREQMEDNTTQIIFISSKENYALQLFKIRPFDFLVKPVHYEHIEQVMDTYIKLFDTKKIFFEYKVGKKINRMNVKEIIYFRSNAKKIEMVTQNGTYEFYEKMNNVENHLDGAKFWRVHKSYIVNCDFVLAYKVNEILLIQRNEIIPISQAYRESIKEKIMQVQSAKRRQ